MFLKYPKPKPKPKVFVKQKNNIKKGFLWYKILKLPEMSKKMSPFMYEKLFYNKKVALKKAV